jgi:hypothetical protein
MPHFLYKMTKVVNREIIIRFSDNGILETSNNNIVWVPLEKQNMDKCKFIGVSANTSESIKRTTLRQKKQFLKVDCSKDGLKEIALSNKELASVFVFEPTDSNTHKITIHCNNIKYYLSHNGDKVFFSKFIKDASVVSIEEKESEDQEHFCPCIKHKHNNNVLCLIVLLCLFCVSCYVLFYVYQNRHKIISNFNSRILI